MDTVILLKWGCWRRLCKSGQVSAQKLNYMLQQMVKFSCSRVGVFFVLFFLKKETMLILMCDM